MAPTVEGYQKLFKEFYAMCDELSENLIQVRICRLEKRVFDPY